MLHYCFHTEHAFSVYNIKWNCLHLTPFSFLFSEPDGVHVSNKNCHTDYNLCAIINTADVQAADAEHQLGKPYKGFTWERGLLKASSSKHINYFFPRGKFVSQWQNSQCFNSGQLGCPKLILHFYRRLITVLMVARTMKTLGTCYQIWPFSSDATSPSSPAPWTLQMQPS